MSKNGLNIKVDSVLVFCSCIGESSARVLRKATSNIQLCARTVEQQVISFPLALLMDRRDERRTLEKFVSQVYRPLSYFFAEDCVRREKIFLIFADLRPARRFSKSRYRADIDPIETNSML